MTLNDNGREGGLPESDVISQYFRFEIIVFILVAITIKIMNGGGGVSQHLRFKLCLELSSKRVPYCLCCGEIFFWIYALPSLTLVRCHHYPT